MKLPFDFATKFLLRLVLPGTLLAALFWPLILAATDRLGVATSDEVRFPVAIILCGWLMMLIDMPVYMVFEGRGYWPTWLFERGVRREARRLDRLRRAEAAPGLSAVAKTEIALRVRQFPLDADGVEQAVYPTRLGNLLRAAETYPDRKYGIDGVFGWFRLWAVMDKDLRGELDDQQAVADSALYAAFCGLLAVPTCLAYAAVRAALPAALPMLPGAGALVALAAASGAAALSVYRLSLHAQAQFGEVLAAVFDAHADRLPFAAIVKDLSETFADPALLASPPRVRNRAAVRFLKWHRYRYTGETVNHVVRGW